MIDLKGAILWYRDYPEYYKDPAVKKPLIEVPLAIASKEPGQFSYRLPSVNEIVTCSVEWCGGTCEVTELSRI